MRDAQSLLDKVISFGGPGEISDAQVSETLGLIDRSLLHRMVEGLCTGDAAACLDVVEQVYGYGYELTQFTMELLEMLRHATFLRMAPEVRRHVDLSDDEVAHLTELLQNVSPDVLTRQFTALLDVHEQIARAQRPRIVLDMAIARLTDIRPAAPVAQLIERLEALEGKIRKNGGGGTPSGGGPAHGRRGGTTSRRGPSTRRASSTSTKPPPMSAKAPPKPAPAPPTPTPAPPAPPAPPADTLEASLQAGENRPPEAPQQGIESLRVAFKQLDGALAPLREAVLTERAKDLLIELPGGRALAAQQRLDNTHLLSRQRLSTHHRWCCAPRTGRRRDPTDGCRRSPARSPVRRIVTALQARFSRSKTFQVQRTGDP